MYTRVCEIVKCGVGAEPMPYISRDALKQALLDGPKLSRDVLVNEETTRSSTQPPLELMTLPVCLQFGRTLAGRSVVGRRLMTAERQAQQSRLTDRQTPASRRTRSVSDTVTTSSAAAAAAAIDDDDDDADDDTVSELKAIVHSKRLGSA